MAGADPVFRRVLLKISGEALMGPLEYGTDPERVQQIAAQVHEVNGRGVEIAMVIGAGNIYRGLEGAAEGMDRATADYMGMLATVLNALTVQDALESLGTHTRVQSAIAVTEVAEPYIRRRAMRLGCIPVAPSLQSVSRPVGWANLTPAVPGVKWTQPTTGRALHPPGPHRRPAG